MKFNRLELIGRLRDNIEKVQNRYNADKAKWDGVFVQWERGEAYRQHCAMQEYSVRIKKALDKLDQLERPLTDEELPRADRLGSKYDHPFAVSVPREIKGVTCPSAPNFTRVNEFIGALQLMLDDEVSSSGIEALGHRDTLRYWL